MCQANAFSSSGEKSIAKSKIKMFSVVKMCGFEIHITAESGDFSLRLPPFLLFSENLEPIRLFVYHTF